MKDDARAIVDLFETVSLGAPQHAVGFVMWRVMHRYIREVDQVLRPFDLTHLQFTLLTLVAWTARSGEISNQSELARFGDSEYQPFRRITASRPDAVSACSVARCSAASPSGDCSAWSTLV